MITLLGFFAFFSSSNTVLGAQVLSFDQVQGILNKGVKTQDEFLGQLPSEFKNRFSLVYQSESLQRACATPDNPRVLFFNEDASLILAVSNANGDSRCHSESFELMRTVSQSRPRESRFEFYSIDFDRNGKLNARLSSANPGRCLNCHGDDPRPFWGPYFIWPGVYGSLDDTLLLSSMLRPKDKNLTLPLETQGYESFMEKQRHAGIYQHLVWDHQRDIPNYLRRRGAGTDYSLIAYHRPNLFLTEQLEEANRWRVLRLLRENFPKGRFDSTLAFGLNQSCQDQGFSLESLIESLPKEIQGRFRSLPIPQVFERRELFNLSEWAASYDPRAEELLQKKSSYWAEALKSFDQSMDRLRIGMPENFWGYLKSDDPKNPTNTELPRIPEGGGESHRADTLDVNGWEVVEYLLNLQGKSSATWFTPVDGFPGLNLTSRAINDWRDSGGLSYGWDCKAEFNKAQKELIEWAGLNSKSFTAF